MIQGLQARFDEACREFNKADSERLSLQEHVQLLQRQAEETRKAHLDRVEELMQQRDLLDLDHAAHRKICEPRIALLEQELETMEGDREEFQGRARDLEQQLQKATRDRDEYKHTAAQVLADKAAMDAEMKKASADVHKAQEIKMRPLAAGELPSTGTIIVVRTEGLCLPCLFLTLRVKGGEYWLGQCADVNKRNGDFRVYWYHPQPNNDQFNLVAPGNKLVTLEPGWIARKFAIGVLDRLPMSVKAFAAWKP